MNKSKKLIVRCALVTLIPFFAMASDEHGKDRTSPVEVDPIPAAPPPSPSERQEVPDPLSTLVDDEAAVTHNEHLVGGQALFSLEQERPVEDLSRLGGARNSPLEQAHVQAVVSHDHALAPIKQIGGRRVSIYKVLGNGDCFFYSLGVPRSDVELMINIKINDLDVSNPLRQKLQSYLDNQLREMRAKRSNIFEGKEASFDQNVVDGFIFEADEMCDIEIMAYVFGRHIEVYQESHDDPSNLILVGNFNNTQDLPNLRVLQSGGFASGHFDLIALDGTPEFAQEQARGAALQEISALNEPGEEGRQALLSRLKNLDWTWSRYQSGPLDRELLEIKMHRLPDEETALREGLFAQTTAQIDRDGEAFAARGKAIEATEALIRFMAEGDRLTNEDEASRRRDNDEEFAQRKQMAADFAAGKKDIQKRHDDAEAARVRQYAADESLARKMQEEDRLAQQRLEQQRQADEELARRMAGGGHVATAQPPIEEGLTSAQKKEVRDSALRREALVKQIADLERQVQKQRRDTARRQPSPKNDSRLVRPSSIDDDTGDVDHTSRPETAQAAAGVLSRPLSAADRRREYDAQRRAERQQEEQRLQAKSDARGEQAEAGRKPGGKKGKK